ncbi:MAG: DUF3244 domain-containing protein [Prevotella sp.]|nr:DUF3244 domain-containing protein [Prevotella sp.]MDE6151822.1 DUF3244 domain-containing protein [Prevotella sp.]
MRNIFKVFLLVLTLCSTTVSVSADDIEFCQTLPKQTAESKGASRIPTRIVFSANLEETTQIIHFSNLPSDMMSYVVYDENGDNVLEDTLQTTEDGTATIDLTGLTEGKYTITINLNGNSYAGDFCL